MTLFNEDILIKVRNRFKIGQGELIRQAYEYGAYRLTREKLEDKQQAYFRFGTIEPQVEEYARLILEEKIKLDSV